jgi:hypothetical protein
MKVSLTLEEAGRALKETPNKKIPDQSFKSSNLAQPPWDQEGLRVLEKNKQLYKFSLLANLDPRFHQKPTDCISYFLLPNLDARFSQKP